MKGALIGFGQAARHGHWPAYAGSSHLSIVAVVDRTEARRRLAETLSTSLRVYPSIEALAAGESIDFIDICTPPALHHEPMPLALARGWHIVCEKPFVIDAAALTRVRALAVDRDRAVVPVHNWKLAPIVLAATEQLRRGAIGRLQRVEIDTERIADSRGADPARPNWRRDPAMAGGGILMDHGWHAVYLALQWFEDQPRAVEAAFHRPRPDGVEDEADVRLVFPRGDAAIRLTWNGKVRRNRMRLIGDRGSMTIDDDRLEVRGAEAHETVEYRPALSAGSHHADWFATFIPQLAGYFAAPSTSRPAFDEAAACLEIIHRAYRAERVPTS